MFNIFGDKDKKETYKIFGKDVPKDKKYKKSDLLDKLTHSRFPYITSYNTNEVKVNSNELWLETPSRIYSLLNMFNVFSLRINNSQDFQKIYKRKTFDENIKYKITSKGDDLSIRVYGWFISEFVVLTELRKQYDEQIPREKEILNYMINYLKRENIDQILNDKKVPKWISESDVLLKTIKSIKNLGGEIEDKEIIKEKLESYRLKNETFWSKNVEAKLDYPTNNKVQGTILAETRRILEINELLGGDLIEIDREKLKKSIIEYKSLSKHFQYLDQFDYYNYLYKNKPKENISEVPGHFDEFYDTCWMYSFLEIPIENIKDEIDFVVKTMINGYLSQTKSINPIRKNVLEAIDLLGLTKEYVDFEN